MKDDVLLALVTAEPVTPHDLDRVEKISGTSKIRILKLHPKVGVAEDEMRFTFLLLQRGCTHLE